MWKPKDLLLHPILKLILIWQDILSVNLERTIQLCVDIGTHIIASTEKEAPDTMGQTFQILSEMNLLTRIIHPESSGL